MAVTVWWRHFFVIQTLHPPAGQPPNELIS